MKKIAGLLLRIFPRPLLIRISMKMMPVADVLFRGSECYDPVNKKSYRLFLPYGYGKQRSNALCPGTFSLERHRQLWLWLENETDFFSKKLSVLHIAPEQCFISRFKKQKNLDYVTADLHSPIVDVKADICHLPFADNAFDVILCNHVLEHIPDDAKAMRELYRVLRPGGFGVLQVPLKNSLDKTFEDPGITDPKERQRLFGQYDHVRQYGMDYFHRLEEAGFRTERNYYSKKFTPDEQYRMGLKADEILPVVYK